MRVKKQETPRDILARLQATNAPAHVVVNELTEIATALVRFRVGTRSRAYERAITRLANDEDHAAAEMIRELRDVVMTLAEGVVNYTPLEQTMRRLTQLKGRGQ